MQIDLVKNNKSVTVFLHLNQGIYPWADVETEAARPMPSRNREAANREVHTGPRPEGL